MASENGHHGVVLSLLGAGADVSIATSNVSDVLIHDKWAYSRANGMEGGGSKTFQS